MRLPDFLTQQPDGEITLTGHRIGLYHIVQHYLEGFSPEMLACQYPTVPLALIHKVLGYYLDNRAEVDSYMAACRHELDRQQGENSRRVDMAALRQRLESRRRAEAS
jgi:uncharacterized protein (DUF433 family)